MFAVSTLSRRQTSGRCARVIKSMFLVKRQKLICQSTSRCSNIANASQFDREAANGKLPNSFYVPDNSNSGHDTGVAFADKWYGQKFSSYISNAQFMANTVLISTFDENDGGGKNQIYTSIIGPT